MFRFLLTALLGVLALVLELWVILLMAGVFPDGEPLFAVLGWQSLAALAAASFFAHCAADKSPAYRRGLFFHAFFLSLFLPVAGQMLMLVQMLSQVLFFVVPRRFDAQRVQTPEFNASLVSNVSYGSAAQIKGKLHDTGAPHDQRVSAMVAMRALPLHLTSTLLRGLLSDPQEEVRLLAYGISNTAESTLTQKIVAATRDMQAARTPAEQATCNSLLAQLHWEMVYQNLVQGELRKHTLERVEHHALAALALDGHNAAMWCVLGRCALLNHDPEHAETCLRQAQAQQYPAQRLLPWLAEAAFMKREYERIGPMLAQLQGRALSPGLQPAVQYWTS